MTRIADCSAAILAGGKNTRYGGFHKAFLRIDDELIIQHHLKLLNSIFDDVMIIANEVELFQQFGVKVFPDQYKNRGPIAGIHSALKHSDKEAVMIFGCDMPFLEDAAIYDLYRCWQNSDEGVVCVPKSNGHLEPLFAVYSKENLDTLSHWLQNNAENAIYKFLNTLNIRTIEMNSRESVFVNINSPEDFDRLVNI